jgi:HK97 family phage major capsid protein
MWTSSERDEYTTLTRRRDELQHEINKLKDNPYAARSEPLTAGQHERLGNLETGLDKIWARLDELKRKGPLADMIASGAAGESGDVTNDRTPVVDDNPFFPRSTRDAALRTVETYERSNTLSALAADKLDRIVRSDRNGMDCRFLTAIGNPAYERAFWHLVTDPAGYRDMAEDERAAMRAVQAAQSERAMAIGSGPTGGYVVPLTLDPTILQTSDGSVNPLRSLARIETISTNEWKGVSSAGITATYAAEAAEVTDDSPTLAQPSVKCERAQAFVPFSSELGADWGGLRAELGRLLQESKDNLEATKFVLGAGTASTEPQGIVAGLGTAYQVKTAGTATFAVDDVYSLKEALPPRFRPNATFLANGDVLDNIYRMVALADATEPPLMSADGRILRKAVAEVSTMSGTIGTGEKIVLFGDIRAAFLIVDRLGSMTIELVPHLLGSSHRPTGMRGLYMFFRNSSAILVPEALRLLKVL